MELLWYQLSHVSLPCMLYCIWCLHSLVVLQCWVLRFPYLLLLHLPEMAPSHKGDWSYMPETRLSFSSLICDASALCVSVYVLRFAQSCFSLCFLCVFCTRAEISFPRLHTSEHRNVRVHTQSVAPNLLNFNEQVAWRPAVESAKLQPGIPSTSFPASSAVFKSFPR